MSTFTQAAPFTFAMVTSRSLVSAYRGLLAVLLAVVLAVVLSSAAEASVVFSSGPTANVGVSNNYRINDNTATNGFNPLLEYYYHRLPADNPVTPVTVRSITFTGVSEAVEGTGDLNHGFELIVGPSVPNIRAIERVDIAPSPLPLQVGVVYSNVQQITIDFDPVTLSAQDIIYFRGDTSIFENFYSVLADPALSNIQLTRWDEAGFTSSPSTEVGTAFAFSFNDNFQIPEPGTGMVLLVSLIAVARRNRRDDKNWVPDIAS